MRRFPRWALQKYVGPVIGRVVCPHCGAAEVAQVRQDTHGTNYVVTEDRVWPLIARQIGRPDGSGGRGANMAAVYDIAEVGGAGLIAQCRRRHRVAVLLASVTSITRSGTAEHPTTAEATAQHNLRYTVQ